MLLMVENIASQLQILWVDELLENSCVVVAGKRQQAGSKKSAKQTSCSRRNAFMNISLIMCNRFRYQTFLTITENIGMNVAVVDHVLSFHEQEK